MNDLDNAIYAAKARADANVTCRVCGESYTCDADCGYSPEVCSRFCEQVEAERHRAAEELAYTQEERNSFRDRVHELEGQLSRLQMAVKAMLPICKAAQDVCESSVTPHLPSIDRLRNAGKNSGINFENEKQVASIAAGEESQ